MITKVVSQGKIVVLVKEISQLGSPNNGFYELFAPIDATCLLPEMRGAIVFTSFDDDEGNDNRSITDVEGIILGTIGDCDMIKDIMEVAREDKHDVSCEEIVEAIDYYLQHDSYKPL